MQETLLKYFSMVFCLPQEKTACVRTQQKQTSFGFGISNLTFGYLSQPRVKPVLSA